MKCNFTICEVNVIGTATRRFYKQVTLRLAFCIINAGKRRVGWHDVVLCSFSGTVLFWKTEIKWGAIPRWERWPNDGNDKYAVVNLVGGGEGWGEMSGPLIHHWPTRTRCPQPLSFSNRTALSPFGGGLLHDFVPGPSYVTMLKIDILCIKTFTFIRIIQ